MLLSAPGSADVDLSKLKRSSAALHCRGLWRAQQGSADRHLRRIRHVGIGALSDVLARRYKDLKGDEHEIEIRAKGGRPGPYVDLRIVDENMVDVAHDGKTTGEIVIYAWPAASMAVAYLAKVALAAPEWPVRQPACRLRRGRRDAAVRMHIRVLRPGAPGGGNEMGQDRENGEGEDPDVRIETVPPRPVAFRQEIRDAVRYKRGLAVKALVVLAVVAVIVILRTLYFS